MLAVGLKQAKQYDKKPILIAKCQNNEKHDLYYCTEGILVSLFITVVPEDVLIFFKP